MTGRRSDASGAPMQENVAEEMGQDNSFWEERHRAGDGKIFRGTRGRIVLDPEWAHFYTAKAVSVRFGLLPALTADTISGSGRSAFASLRTRGLRPLATLKQLSLNVTNTVFFNEKGGIIT